MNLHENKDLFTAAIQLASNPKSEGGLGIKEIYIEKDYWICRSLKQLSECKESEVAVFKGGTSLSKAYRLGSRFSEDIDIAITNDSQRTDNQTKSIISRISRAMSAGLEEVRNPATRKYSKYRKAFYRYPITEENEIIGAINHGQILLEIVSFANPYPYQKIFIKSFSPNIWRELTGTISSRNSECRDLKFKCSQRAGQQRRNLFLLSAIHCQQITYPS